MTSSLINPPGEHGTRLAHPPTHGHEFVQCVPRHLVHRTAINEVLLTHAHQDGVDRWTVGAQWPRSHAFFERVDRTWHDPLIAAETLRQAGLLVSHVGYGVPQDHQFLIGHLGYRVTADHLRDTGRAANIVVRLRGHDIRRRNEGITSMRLAFDLLRDGSSLGSGEATFRVVGPRGYARLRPENRYPSSDRDVPVTAPVHPWLVGRDRPSDTVLSPLGPVTDQDTARWRLRVDRDHPVLFDHPVDHVPGMLLAEASRQAAQAVSHPATVLPVGMSCSFHQYVEFDSPCLVTAERIDDETIEVSAVQDGQRKFTGRVTVQPLPAPATEVRDAVPCGC